MDCPICGSRWNSSENIPKILKCGHSICFTCVKSSIQNSLIICPECKDLHTVQLERHHTEQDSDFTFRCANALSTNISLLVLMTEVSERRPLKVHTKCLQHGYSVHSYTATPYSLLCNSCIEEIKQYKLPVKVIPQVSNYLRSLLQQSSEAVTSRSRTIHLILERLQSIQESYRSDSLEVLESHFAKVRAALNSHFEVVRTQFEQKLTSKIMERDNKTKELNSKLHLLHTLITRVKDIKELPETQIVTHLEESQHLLKQTNLPIPEPLQPKLAFIVNPSYYKILQKTVDRSYRFKLVSDQSKNWLCQCQASNYTIEIVCCNCGVFRPLDTFENILDNPNSVTEQELLLLEQRRKQELLVFSRLDYENKSPLKYFLVNSDWLSQWKAFVKNRDQNSSTLSTNPKIGVLPPGPVSNYFLFTDPANPLILKNRLKPRVNYKGVNEQMWDMYLRIYGGGPAIARTTINIYEGLE